jgi:hygromycin-B 7''-O-kinase
VLPTIHTRDDYQRVKHNHSLVRAVCATICARHDIKRTIGAPFQGGSLIVVALGGDLVLKLYSPVFPDDMPRDRLGMRHLHGRVPAPPPGGRFSGHLDGWPYMIMDRLEGQPLEEVRDRIPRADLLDLCREAGSLLEAVHQLPAEGMEDIKPDWSAFRAEQFEKAIEQQRNKGLTEDWLRAVAAFLPNIPRRSEDAWKPSLLHTEFMADHLLVSANPRRITGLIDFEPSMVGDPEYDFASAILFVTGADEELQRAFFDGYDLRPEERDTHFKARVMGYILLHVYSNLPWYFQFMPVPEAPNIHELIKSWMP